MVCAGQLSETEKKKKKLRVLSTCGKPMISVTFELGVYMKLFSRMEL